ncbi:hypothetical protein [Limisphaera sp. 4302-co]|uniref:hypothetical protein n=1 Tax=Limisphaera sp. 4302-co TaxID=3400417 RepID=UPI003C138588
MRVKSIHAKSRPWTVHADAALARPAILLPDERGGKPDTASGPVEETCGLAGLRESSDRQGDI